MADLLIALPGLIALIVCLRSGPQAAFLNVYLPVLLLLPQFYHSSLSGQLTFADNTIIPIAVAMLLQRGARRSWDGIDFLVFAYLAITCLAEGINKGYKLGAQNLAIHELGECLLPYVVARGLFARPEMAIAIIKRMVVLLALVGMLSVYEFRMGSDLFTRFWVGIFPVNDGTVVFRAGFMRTQGPYGHAIAFGIMMAIGWRLVRWLEWKGIWRQRLAALPISKIVFCEAGLAAGALFSISIGPWFAAGCGAVAAGLCRARKRGRALVAVLLLVGIVGMPAYSSFRSFISVSIAAASLAGNQWQQDSAYRDQLLTLYIPVVKERPSFGWGIHGFPVLDQMISVDNGYLLTALTYGVYAMALLIALMVWPALRLAKFSLPLPRDDPRTLDAFTLIGIFVVAIVVNGTVSMPTGPTEWRTFFLMLGWAAALLRMPRRDRAISRTREVAPPFVFRRVMA